jgi:hypothetical protein
MHPMILELVRIRPDGSYTPWGDEHRLDDLFTDYSVDLESLPSKPAFSLIRGSL